jgi:hypothetical protein
MSHRTFIAVRTLDWWFMLVSSCFLKPARSRGCANQEPSTGEIGKRPAYPRLLKCCTARSCRSADSRVGNVPRFRRFPVLGSCFREYSRYFPSDSFRIMAPSIPKLRTPPDPASRPQTR